MSLIAKQIIKNQLWVITDGTNKVGNIEANNNSTYSVKIGENVNYFSSTKHIERDVQLTFERPVKYKQTTDISFARWPTDCKTYNDFYDLKRKIHVYTKTKASKCYYAAGYYRIELNGVWTTLLSPKYIFIQRYPYEGPFMSIDDIVAVDK
jgi:hypothetical protein